MPSTIAVIGGGLSGLSCAIRLAERGYGVSLYEAAPELGGRTRSYYDSQVRQWVDHGPHLLIGAYSATRKLLHAAADDAAVTWQPQLTLPLWDKQRGLFMLQPSPRLPLPLGLPLALRQLPGHNCASALAMLRLGLKIRGAQSGSVAGLMQAARIPAALQRDLIEPLCLGSMNATMAEADAASFAAVLQEAFASRDHARLGWFNRPLQQGLIQPLAEYAIRLGVHIHTRSRLRSIEGDGSGATLTFSRRQRRFRRIVLALPPQARNQLFGVEQPLATQPITNVHLWLRDAEPLPQPLVGGIGTYSQWFFDVSAQMHEKGALRHLCAIISADTTPRTPKERLQLVLKELRQIQGGAEPQLEHHRIIQVQQATTLVGSVTPPALPASIVDACEQPQPGDLPGTIETAIRRGEEAARLIALAT